MKRRVTMNFIQLIEWLENNQFLDSTQATSHLRNAGVILPRTLLEEEE